ncbi:MAG: hypothetical protein E7325_02880 [Clostridiales bacterium]|jgi:uncharacterized membrane protein|nr:hypothetical protein [Clostridiales bacterium]
MKLEKGTPGFGILCGVILALLGALVMIIGFWKALILALLFAVGFFLGSVGDKQGFIKKTANRIIPAKDDTPINIRQEITREQEQYTAAPKAMKEDGE